MPPRPPVSLDYSIRWEELASALEAWFRDSKRDLPWRRTYDPYEVWVSEVMLQQTRVSVVVPYFLRFVERFPTITSLAEAETEEVLARWSGLGYYRRARMLQEGARYVVREHGGTLPRDPAELQKIPGIGRYTAGAIQSIAFDERAPLVDGNVARVFARHFALEGEAGSSRLMAAAWEIAGRLVASSGSPRDLNQSLMELGATVCTPRQPSCPDCPLQSSCATGERSLAEKIPPPAKRRATTLLRIPLYVVMDDRGRVLLRRERGALMRGMFHLPHGGDGLLGKSPGKWKSVGRVASFRHAVTHRNIEFVVEKALPPDELREGSDDWILIHPNDLATVPHPSYVAKALKLFQEHRADFPC